MAINRLTRLGPSKDTMIREHHEIGKYLHHLDQPLDHVIDPAAKEARYGAHDRADDRLQHHAQGTDQQGNTPAIDDAGPHVSADRVRTQPVFAAGRFDQVVRVGCGRLIARDQRRSQRDDQQHADHDRAEDAETIAQIVLPGARLKQALSARQRGEGSHRCPREICNSFTGDTRKLIYRRYEDRQTRRRCRRSDLRSASGWR